MNAKDYLLGGLAGFVAGGLFSWYSLKPTTAYEIKLDGHDRDLLIVKNRGNTNAFLVKQADGSFKNLDDVQENESAEIIQRTKDIKSKLMQK